MCVAWRHRLAIPALAILVFIVCGARAESEVQFAKLVYPRGNQRAVADGKTAYPHWAIGHLMGKKSIDEPLGSDELDGRGEQYLTAPEAEGHTQPSRFLQALITALAGPENERERDASLRQQRALEQGKLLEQLEREREQAAKLLLLALNMKDADAS
ncbi:gastrin-releasing peptide [Colossoma macropomum]|uniref:gastrin-releasing peptide n=1 Tax=Colossoma macropomum TaxID=42526 RepID=UPI0018651FCD|nr:gastrin-releasing peptide [Colossoma macropomum]